MEDTAKVVRAFFDAWTSKDFPAAWPLIHDELVIESPLGNYQGSASWKPALTDLAGQVSAVTLLALMSERDEAMILYDLKIAGLDGLLRVFEYSTVVKGKIMHTQQVFDTVEVRKIGLDNPALHVA
jgi:hypothetical protein